MRPWIWRRRCPGYHKRSVLQSRLHLADQVQRLYLDLGCSADLWRRTSYCHDRVDQREDQSTEPHKRLALGRIRQPAGLHALVGHCRKYCPAGPWQGLLGNQAPPGEGRLRSSKRDTREKDVKRTTCLLQKESNSSELANEIRRVRVASNKATERTEVDQDPAKDQ